jgi:hypothetical protein
MTKRTIPLDWIDNYQLPALEAVIDELPEELLDSLDELFPDFVPDLDIPALADRWLESLWREIGSRHFGGSLPACRIAWAENLKAPARLEAPDVVLLDTRLMTGDTDKAMGVIAMVLLHCAVLLKARGYGPEFRQLANRIGMGMGLRSVKTERDARSWLFRTGP